MNVFALAASITLNTKDYEKSLEDAGGKTHSFGEKLKGALGTVAKVGATAIKGAAMAVGTATTAVGALAKVALDSYGNYEQLVGGVETLFKDSSDVVMEYANNAYKTAGLSANEYMETVTSFSASLLQSLDGDTAAAAKYADTAITDMSDNANKMGTDMEMIQNAYNGFAKANFTMLDNLKLGYGGTKEEMQRLLEDAEKISGIEYDISSYADIVDAIHTVQVEMGISGITAEEAAAAVASGAMTQEEAFAAMGTTAKEAATTIQGSVSAAKSAWQNLVAGLGDENANLDQLIGNLVTSVETAAGNILPRVTQILSGMGRAIQKLAPILTEQIPEFVAEVLPPLIDAGAQLLIGLITGLISALPMLVEAIPGIIQTLVNAIWENAPLLLDSGSQLLNMLTSGIIGAIPNLLPTAVNVIGQLVATLVSPSSLGFVLDAALQLITALGEGLIKAIPALLEAIPEIIYNLIRTLIESGPQFTATAIQLIFDLGVGLVAAIPQLLSFAVNVPAAVLDALIDGFKNVPEIGKNIVRGLWNGIQSLAGWLWDMVASWCSSIWNGILGFFGIHSPSTEMAWVGEMLVKGLSGSIKRNGEEAVDAAESMASNILGAMDGLGDEMEKMLPTSFAADIGANISQISTADSSAGAASGTPQVFNITINGAKYADENALVQRLMREIQYATARREAIYA